jgi:hypothetical protein
MTASTEERALSWIETHLGIVSNLHREVIAVIWVTVYRSMEIGAEARSRGGPYGLAADKFGGGDLVYRLKKAICELDFLKKKVPCIQREKSSWGKAASSQLFIDMLKWGLLDAPNMSLLRRTFARRRAKADPMYDRPVPPQLTERC